MAKDFCDYVGVTVDEDWGTRYHPCNEEATHNVADARGEFVGCSKVCTEHAREILAAGAARGVWGRGARNAEWMAARALGV
jgi:hypothetical protein